jgi:cation diffusion facilitator CzcD-associated flavoprotein CzcO
VDAEQILVVGSGFGGLGMGIRLESAGIDTFTIFERAREVGGTWRDNHYPGCACDIPSHLYSFSFEPLPTWARTYGEQWQILEYLRHCADRYHLRPHIRFGAEIVDARWDEDRRLWELRTSGGETARGRVLVSACGGLSRPSLPDIRGRESFAGASFHSSQWDHDFDLTGKTVAVIGTGASAIQFVPRIAPHVGKLVLYQRTPPWILPKRDRPIAERTHRLFERAPVLQKLARLRQYLAHELRGVPFVVDKRLFQVGRKLALGHLEAQIPDPQLRARLTPSYTPGCKRILIANDYYPALARDNVDLVTTGIERIDATGVVDTDGVHRPVDAIIYGTGFRVGDFLGGVPVRGRHGVDLNDVFGRDTTAYMGTSVAGFPNMFLLLGPNTGLGHNSMVFMIESQIAYILDAIESMRRLDLESIDVRPEAMSAFNEKLHARLDRAVWADGCHPWYLTRTGKNTTLWPGFTFEFRYRTRKVNLDEFDVTGPERRSAPSTR